MDVRDTPLVTILNSAVCLTASASATTIGWSMFVLSVVRRPPGSRRLSADLLKELPRAKVPLMLAPRFAAASFVSGIGSLQGQPGYDPVKHPVRPRPRVPLLTGLVLLLIWRLGFGKPGPGQDALGAA